MVPHKRRKKLPNCTYYKDKIVWHLDRKPSSQMTSRFFAGKVYRDVLFEFHLKFWNTASIGIPVWSLLYIYKVDRLLTGLTAQQKGTTARWNSP